MVKPRSRGAPASKSKPAEASAPPGLVPIQFRFPTELIGELDTWTAELNEGRSWPHLTRSDVVRGVLVWALKERPQWEGKVK